jgi:hypothetical protein
MDPKFSLLPVLLSSGTAMLVSVVSVIANLYIWSRNIRETKSEKLKEKEFEAHAEIWEKICEVDMLIGDGTSGSGSIPINEVVEKLRETTKILRSRKGLYVRPPVEGAIQCLEILLQRYGKSHSQKTLPEIREAVRRVKTLIKVFHTK